MIKKIFFNITIVTGLMILTFGLSNCNRKSIPSTAEVHYVKTTNKTITLTATGYGKRVNTAVLNAERNAFDKLLFRGIPGSQFSNPMISNPTVKAKHTEFFERFFDDQGYRTFVTQSRNLTPASRDKKVKQKRITVEITINYHSLRKELENNGIIHKFGL